MTIFLGTSAPSLWLEMNERKKEKNVWLLSYNTKQQIINKAKRGKFNVAHRLMVLDIFRRPKAKRGKVPWSVTNVASGIGTVRQLVSVVLFVVSTSILAVASRVELSFLWPMQTTSLSHLANHKAPRITLILFDRADQFGAGQSRALLLIWIIPFVLCERGIDTHKCLWVDTHYRTAGNWGRDWLISDWRRNK